MSTAPPAAAPPNLETIGNLVRHWVHYDNSIAAINKQLKNVRDLRHTYEAQILQMLQASSLKNPVIQIVGGRLNVVEDKTQQPLTFTMLETMLDRFYDTKPGAKRETKDILKFIRENRSVQISQALKRHMNGTSRTKEKEAKD